tara:strand:+ start:622 stop:1275 length:654 start_codon:yes stop_codon:yes gene_type:complete
MAYIPKSKIKIQETLGDEFLNKISKRPYKGSYIETSDGKFYAGNNSTNLSLEIHPLPKTHFRGGSSEDITKYIGIKPNIHKILSELSPIIGTKPKPLQEDYTKGFFIRFFVRRINSDTQYTEVDEIIFTKLKRQDSTYDYHLYQIGAIKWALRGDVININTLTIKRNKKLFPFLITLFPQNNEYQRTEDIISQPSTTSFKYQFPTSPSTSGGGGSGY